MALTNLHTDWTLGSYFGDRNDLVKREENKPLYQQVTNGQQGQTFAFNSPDSIRLGLQPYTEPTSSGPTLAVGYGFDLYENTVSDIVAFLGQVGVTLSSADINALNNRNSLTPSQLKSQLSFTLGNEITASNLMGLYLEQKAETHLDSALGYHFAESKERAALVSLVYNGGPGIIGPKLLNALQSDNRAEAWYEIRYNSNADGQHTERRINESKLFSLYDNPGQGASEAEAKEVLRMYTIHQPEIQEYESRFAAQFPTGGTDTVVFQVIGAKTTLIPIYNAGKSIDGEVLVGNEFGNILDEYGRLVLDKNDLLFGEGGNDFLYGHGGTDVLYGGDGGDTLVGGAGDDHLEGGAGFDTYRWRTGDGHDRIEDSDADGAIFVNGQMLTGGVKKAGHTYWENADGTLRYEMAGTDLVVKLNGQTIMTVNEDFQSGQFGIELFDGPDIPDYENGLPFWRYYAETLSSPDGPPRDGTNVLLYGAQSFDVFSGYHGNDQIYGYGGGDQLTGGLGHDRVYGGDGNDWMTGGIAGPSQWPDPWTDSIDSLDGDDYLDGENGNDNLSGQAGNDRLFGGAGNDSLYGDGDPILRFYLVPSGGDDFLDGGAGNDFLHGDYGADVLYGGDDDDVLRGDYIIHYQVPVVGGVPPYLSVPIPFDVTRAQDDFLDGGAGDDEMYGDGGDDTLIGGAGNDQLIGDYKREIYTSTGWTDDGIYQVGPPWTDEAVLEEFGNDVLEGGEGDDELNGQGGDDVLAGGVGADILFGDVGADTLFGNEGDDFLYGDTDGPEVLTGANDFLDGGDGNDQLVGESGDDTLTGGLGNDLLVGDSDLNPSIAGADTLFGDEGDDQLLGGGGNDALFGGSGNDLLFGEQTSFQGQAGDDILDGGEGIDQLQGGGGADTLFGGEGNDTLFGDDPLEVSLVGNDILDGEAGDDELQGGLGNDTIFGGEGNDALRGDRMALALNPSNGGNDTLDGGAGNDELDGDSGNDVLIGGTGQDLLIGGSGQDTYRFNLGDGIDTIEDMAGEGNRLVLGSSSTAVTLGMETSDTLVLRVGTAGDAVRIINFGVLTPAGAHPIDSFEFSDGTVLTYSQLLARGFQHFGTAGSESLTGTEFIDRIAAGDGDDTVSGRGGSDTLLGEAGNDRLYGDAGDDTLDGGDGNDELRGAIGTDVLSGGAGDDLLFGDDGSDRLLGGSGNDTYWLSAAGDVIVEFANEGIDTVKLTIPGPYTFVLPDQVENVELRDDTYSESDVINLVGNQQNNQLAGGDLLDGKQGNDTLIGLGDNIYVFGRGYGQDVIQTGQQTYASQGFLDYIQLLAGVMPTDVTFESQGSSLVMKITGTSDQMMVANYLDGTPTVGQIHFADGTIWGETEIRTRLPVLTGTNGNDSLPGFDIDNQIFGLGGDDQLFGNGGVDRLDGGAGNDYLVGGDGSDTYLFGRGGGQDWVNDFPPSGTIGEIDTILLDNTVIPADVRLQATTGSGLLLTIAGSTDQLLVESYFVDPLYQIERIQFADGTIWDAAAIASRTEGLTLVGTEEDDMLFGISLNDTLSGLGGSDILSGQGGNDLLLGGDGDDSLDGGSGNDTLDGGVGIDTLMGGSGNDIFVVDNVGDVVTEQTSQGTDTVQSSITYTLGANVENLTLTGTAAINGTGNTLNNVLTGNSAANVLAGGTGNDTYVVDSGDTVTEAASAGTDTVQSSITWTLDVNLENLTLLGTAAINGTGNTLNNTLLGNSAANVLDGGVGADSLRGGAGNDTYMIDSTSDTITENLNEGTDLVQSAVTYTLAANVENLILTGTTAINGTGNTLDNVLTGNSAANVLTGGTGADSMAGGAGNDTYVVDNVSDTVSENLNEGTDLVQSSVTYTLGANVENLTLTGTTAINGTGNGLNNTLTGNTGNNILDGGTGADAMSGGTGNDTYVVDNAADTVTEAASAGTDLVQSAVTYTLGSNLENLTLTGTTAINGTGNTLDNILTGNSAANVLTGGAGNDTYVVGTGDTVTEAASAGTDTVQSAITWTLGANLENLTLTGTTAINGTGNALDNILTGNSAANVLTGGAGNDTYVVGTGDTVTEAASAGTDTVRSAITWTLGANLENLTLTGTTAINGTGNTLDNVLIGNSVNNVLTGLGGSDTYLYSRGGGQDTVVDNAGTADKMLFGATINPLDLVISRQVNDLRLSIHGSSDVVTIQNWYSGATNQTETIQAGNGQTLLSTKVDQLIQAMASFTQQTGLSWDQAIDQQPQQVQTILAANWQ